MPSRTRSIRNHSRPKSKHKHPPQNRSKNMALSTRSSKGRKTGKSPDYFESARTSDIEDSPDVGEGEYEGAEGSGEEYIPKALPSKRRNLLQISPTPSEDIVMQDSQGSQKDEAPVSGAASDDVQPAEEEDIVDDDAYDVEEEEPLDDAMVAEEVEDFEDENVTTAVSPSNAVSKGTTSKGKTSPSKPSLKIRLKFTGVASTDPTPTPSDEMPTRSGRKINARRVEESESESDESTSSRSPSVVPPTRMTQRQAARARGENAELLVLDESTSRRKKELNEAELALKREENARKRKNLTEKKLEDEKTETINRLLKRQSRPRGKKVRVAEPEEEGEEGEEETFTAAPTPPEVPTMYRWISTSRKDCPALSFSVPPSLLPEPEAMPSTTVQPLPPKVTPICDVGGCGQPRKYKLVKDPTRGGCGMEHLRALQVTMS